VISDADSALFDAVSPLLSQDQDLMPEAAGNLMGGSRGVVLRWMKDPANPLRHEDRPGQRPAALISEYDLLKYALGETARWREAAREVLSSRWPDIGEGNPTMGERRIDPSIAPQSTAGATDTRTVKHPPHGDQRDHTIRREAPSAASVEVGRLQTENLRLAERLSRTLDILDRESQAHRQAIKEWIAAMRSEGVPGDLSALESMIEATGGRP
jgi:hypothetical protein